MRRILAAVLLALAGLDRADAQEIAASVWSYAPFGIDDLDGELPGSGELRVSVPLSDRFAIEPFVTAGSRRRSWGIEGFYGAQVRQRIVSLTRDEAYAFATYGAAGQYSRWGAGGPIIGHFGFGLYQRLTARLAFRPELHVMTFHVVPVGVRFVAGISVKLRPT